MTTTNRPADSERFGNIEVALWPRKIDKGTLHDYTLKRVYKNSEGQLKSSAFLSRHDRFDAVRAIVWASERISQLNTFERAASETDSPGSELEGAA